jgi:DNA/RNA-binding domain of Phe-tRNA-synthetase-like protein
MTFLVSPECLALGLRAGAVVFHNVHVAATDAALRSEIGREVERIHTRFASLADIRALPNVVALGELLHKVGVNPRKQQPSVERLLGFALRRGDLPAVNSLVDAYNLVSVRSLCSMGAHDLDRITPPVTLRLLTGHESFTPLGRDQTEPVTAGEYGYVDARDRVLCRLDLLQAEFSKVTVATSNVLLIIEGTTAHAPEVLRQTFDEAVETVTRVCGGTADVAAWPDV